MNLLIGFFTVILILVSLFMVLIILMQRPRSDSGLGAALGGGGAAESAFGAETGNILSRSTIYCAIFFFVATFLLYLGHMYTNHREISDVRGLPEIRGAGDIEPLETQDGEALPVPGEGAVPAEGEEAEMVPAEGGEEASAEVEEPAEVTPAESVEDAEPVAEEEESVPPSPLD